MSNEEIDEETLRIAREIKAKIKFFDAKVTKDMPYEDLRDMLILAGFGLTRIGEIDSVPKHLRKYFKERSNEQKKIVSESDSQDNEKD